MTATRSSFHELFVAWHRVGHVHGCFHRRHSHRAWHHGPWRHVRMVDGCTVHIDLTHMVDGRRVELVKLMRSVMHNVRLLPHHRRWHTRSIIGEPWVHHGPLGPWREVAITAPAKMHLVMHDRSLGPRRVHDHRHGARHCRSHLRHRGPHHVANGSWLRNIATGNGRRCGDERRGGKSACEPHNEFRTLHVYSSIFYHSHGN